MERYRDPVHGFIEVRPLEKKLIDSAPFQRLREYAFWSFTWCDALGDEGVSYGC